MANDQQIESMSRDSELRDIHIGIDWITAFFRKEVLQFMEQTTETLRRLMGAVDDLTASLNAIQASTAQLATDVAKILSNQEALAAKLRELADKGQAGKAELEALANQAATISGDLSAVQEAANRAANPPHPDHTLPGPGSGSPPYASTQPTPGIPQPKKK